MHDVKPVTEVRATLGEGAIWYEDLLYWVDIIERCLYVYDPGTDRHRRIDLPQMVGTVVPRRRGGLVAALANGFAFLDPQSARLTPITDPEADKPDNRFNDGKCDPAGRFWAGTMEIHGHPGLGALYVLHPDGKVERKLDGVSISNGIVWSHDRSRMYYIDTPTHQVAVFDYDADSGEIRNRRVAVEIDRAEGAPDGMTIDAQGNLWIALWDGGAVVCHDPHTGKRIEKVSLPVSRVTSCAFGGDELADLYITSAKVGLDEEQRKRQPLAGGTFVTRVGVRGVPAFAFAG